MTAGHLQHYSFYSRGVRKQSCASSFADETKTDSYGCAQAVSRMNYCKFEGALDPVHVG